MAEIDPVILQLRADVREYNARVQAAERMTAKSLGEIERRGDRMASGLTRGFNMAARAALTYVTAISAVGAAREFLRIADGAKQIEAQLRLATRESGNFAQAQEDVRRIAAETRTGLAETATLYATLQRNSRELGRTQQETAQLTQAVTQTFLISGATASEAAGGLRQFIQGLQSGTLRGEEFNSVMENAPRLAKALSDSLGVPIGQLRKMAEAGELTGERVSSAVLSAAKSIDGEFRELPVTFDQAMTQVENAAMITFGAFDRGGGFSQMLANFVSDGAEGFGDLEDAAQETGIEIRAAFEGLADVFGPMVNAAFAAFNNIDVRAEQSAASMRWMLQQFDDFANMGTAPARWVERKMGWGPGKGQSDLAGNFDNARATYLQGAERARRDRRNQIAAQGIADIFGKYDNLGNPIAPPRPRPAPATTGSSTKPAGRSGRSGPSAETLARRAEQEPIAGIRDEAAKQRELASLNDDLAAARAALVTATQDILRFELQQIESEKAQRIAQLQTEVDIGKLGQDEFAARKAILEEIAKAKVQRANINAADEEAAATARQASNARRDEIATRQAEADLIDVRKDRLAAERRILDLIFQEEEAAIRGAAARGEIADLDQALANMKRRQLAEEQRVSRDFESPLQRYSRSLNEQDLGDEAEKLIVEEIEHVRRGMRDAISDAIGTDDPLITGLIDLLLQDLIFKPLANALSKSGGSGGLLSTIGNAIGALFGSGGPTNLLANTPYRAGGGRVSAGTLYRVNEGAGSGRAEGFRPDVGGQIIPLGRMNAVRGGAGEAGTATVRVELSGDIDARIARVSGPVAVEVVQASAPMVIDAAANETLRRANRPGL